MSSEISVLQITPNSLTATTVGTQGLSGPNSILGKSVADGTVSNDGSILLYSGSLGKWEATLAPRNLTIDCGNF